VIRVAEALEVGLVIEVALVAAVQRDILRGWDDVIDVSARFAALAEFRDLAQRISRKDARPGSLAPLR
jgi:hypothetical protein